MNEPSEFEPLKFYCNREISNRKLAKKCCTLFAGSSQAKGLKSSLFHTHMRMESSGFSKTNLKNIFVSPGSVGRNFFFNFSNWILIMLNCIQ